MEAGWWVAGWTELSAIGFQSLDGGVEPLYGFCYLPST
jgi:hypothetical protein